MATVLRLRLLRRRKLEEAARERLHALRADRHHVEIARIVEMPVHADRQHADGHHVVLHDDRHGGRRHVGRVGTEQQIDFVDRDELGVDARHVRRIALVVVIDELDRPAEQPAVGVDVVAPQLERDDELLAVLRHSAGQGHAEADLDRIGRARRSGERERQHNAGRRNDPPDIQHGRPPKVLLRSLAGGVGCGVGRDLYGRRRKLLHSSSLATSLPTPTLPSPARGREAIASDASRRSA